MTLTAQRIVVVGGTSGIGFAIAELAQREGAAVVVASSKPAKVERAVERLAGRAQGLVLDVNDERAVAGAFEKLGPFDHLAFTAGDWKVRNVAVRELDLDRAGSGFGVRFWGALRVIKHAHPVMSASGSITLTDGMVAHRPSKASYLSTAMAGAIEHLTRGLAVELAPIRVNAVCPGLILTEVWDGIPSERRQEQFERMTKRLPLPRIGEAGEAAEAYLYLMRGGYTTGQILRVDGGASLV
jgi:NAD(P)-dependent dehydrogenase (short-subunit alcohol dehydrogenase family)